MGKRHLAAAMTAFGILFAVAGFTVAGGEPVTHQRVPRTASFSGTLDIVSVCDLKTGSHELHYYLREGASSPARRLRFAGPPPEDLESGDFVRISASLDHTSGELHVPSGAEKSLNVVSTKALAQEKALTARRAVVLMVNFNNKTHTLSRTDIAKTMFSDVIQSVDGLYREASFNQIAFPKDTDGDGMSDVFGPFTIPYSSSSKCDYIAWGDAADAAARKAGVDLDLYQHIVYVMPGSSCGWAGIASVGCARQCRVWVASPQYADVFAHELGHNLGMRHAATDTNNDGKLESEYGDRSDIMGYSGSGWRQFNAPHKVRMGWFNAYPGSVVNVTSGGTYRIAPLEMKPNETGGLPQVLKVASSVSGEYYYLAFRVRMGYDTTLGSAYSDGCAIHRYKDGASVPTRYITTLRNGNSFVDTASKFTVEQLRYSNDPKSGYLDVKITLNGSSDTKKPTVTGASARNARTVRVTFSESMKNDGALVSPAQYTFTGSPAITAQSVTRIDGQNVDVIVNEMRQGASYKVAVGTQGPADLAGNRVDANANSRSFTGIGDAPIVAITPLDPITTNLDAVRYTVAFSEPVAPTFGADDLTATGTLGGTASVSVAGQDPNYIVTLRPSSASANGTLGLQVGGTITDKAGNACAGGKAAQTYTIDNTPPSIAFGTPSSKSTGVATFPVNYGDAHVITLSAGDVTLHRTGTANGSVSVSGTGSSSRTVTVSNITGTGTLAISIAAGTARDAAGNAAPASPKSGTVKVENDSDGDGDSGSGGSSDGPAVGVSLGDPWPGTTRTGRITFQVTYSNAASVSLRASDVKLHKTGTATGTVSVVGTDPTFRTIQINNVSGDGTLAVSLAAGTATGPGGSAPAVGPSKSVTVDNTPPSVEIGSPSASTTQTGPVSFPITYTGATHVLLEPADVKVHTSGSAKAGKVSVAIDGNTGAKVTLSSITGSGTLAISLAPKTARDGLANYAPAVGPSAAVKVNDPTRSTANPPTVKIGSPWPGTTRKGRIEYTVTYGNATDINLSPAHVTLHKTGTATGRVSVLNVNDTTRTVRIDGVDGTGTLAISLAAGTATGPGGAAPATKVSETVEVDNTPPSVEIGSPSPSVTDRGPVTFPISFSGATHVLLSPSHVNVHATGSAKAGRISVTVSGNTGAQVILSDITGTGTLAISLDAKTARDGLANYATAVGSGPSVRVN